MDTNNSFLKRVEKNILTPSKIKPIYTSSVADENVFANKLNIPVLTLGPIGGNAHIAGEWLSLNSMSTVQTIYIDILRSYNNLEGNSETKLQ